MLSKQSQIIRLTILCFISCIIAGIILIVSYHNIYFYPKLITNNTLPDDYQAFAKIISLEPEQMLLLYTNQFESISIDTNRITNIDKFDPYTHDNTAITISDLKTSDHIVLLTENKNYHIVLMPPHSINGIISHLSPDKITILSQDKSFDFLINEKTVYLNPTNQQIIYETLLVGNMVFIYSDYSDNDLENNTPLAASIQIMVW